MLSYEAIDTTSTPSFHTVVNWQNFQNQYPNEIWWEETFYSLNLTFRILLLFVFIYYDYILNKIRNQDYSSFWFTSHTHSLTHLTPLPDRMPLDSLTPSLSHSLTLSPLPPSLLCVILQMAVGHRPLCLQSFPVVFWTCSLLLLGCGCVPMQRGRQSFFFRKNFIYPKMGNLVHSFQSHITHYSINTINRNRR